jgi:sulfotransferase family protein
MEFDRAARHNTDRKRIDKPMALEIIGPGFGRTGTNSLKLALEHLGFGPCHHMFEIRDKPELLADWQAAARGERVGWNRVFSGYRSQVDWPGARYWRELLQWFPDAKVILSVRDPDEWFDSVQATIAPLMIAHGSHPSPHLNAIAEMAYQTVVAQIFNGRISDRQHATRVFREHIDEVRRTVASDRLLVFDLKDGWTPLCNFLSVKLPTAPFPRTNSSNDFADVEWKKVLAKKSVGQTGQG